MNNTAPNQENNSTFAAPIWQKPAIRIWAGWLAGILFMTSATCFISNGFSSFSNWAAFLGVTLLAAGVLWLGIWLLHSEQLPKGLVALVIAAAVLRLAFGAGWLFALPLWGHGSAAEKSGYVMADASARDQAAWKLAQSERPLISAFKDNRTVDQYGGLLFLSAFIYRYVGGNAHYPLMMVLISAAFSSLSIAFTWAFARRIWNTQIAWLAAWIVALYPEALLIGSSQMREAFTITLGIAAFYGLVRTRQEHSKSGVLWLFIPLILYLPFSPPFAAMLLGMLALFALFTSTSFFSQRPAQSRLWLVIAVLTILVLAGLWLVLRQFAPEGMSNPLEMLGWWLRKSAGLQAYLSKIASGWLQKTFKAIPEWAQLPLLGAYGVLQPFLPAALVVGSHAPIWPWITGVRSTGWTLMLILLIYAPFLAFRQKENGRFARAISLVVWLGILIASFRGGGDMWDNPRYRTAFIGLQASLAAWAWIEQRRLADPWLRRAGMALLAVLAWFIPWYARRYLGFAWPVVNIFLTIGLGVASAALLIFWDWTRSRRSQKTAPEQETNPKE